MQILDPAFDASRVRLIVYDLDGTLVDAFEDIWNAVNHGMRTAGLPELSLERVRRNVGDGARMLLQRCLGEEYASHLDQVFPEFAKFYLENPNPRACLYSGVAETLHKLNAVGFQQAVLSNKPHHVTGLTCQSLGLCECVQKIWGEETGRPRKPDPASLEAVMQHFGVNPAQTVMVGDGPADHAVAQAAGVPMIAVTYGLLSHEETLKLNPAVIIDCLAELLELFIPSKMTSMNL